jgi:hypothetical protein
MMIVGGVIVAWIGVTLGIALRRAARAAFKGDRPGYRMPVHGAFPVVPVRETVSSPPPLMVENIRRFRVAGVDAMKIRDVAYVVDAASAENAKVKAELAGVIVTKVVEVPRSAAETTSDERRHDAGDGQ